MIEAESEEGTFFLPLPFLECSNLMTSLIKYVQKDWGERQARKSRRRWVRLLKQNPLESYSALFPGSAMPNHSAFGSKAEPMPFSDKPSRVSMRAARRVSVSFCLCASMLLAILCSDAFGSPISLHLQ
ncbi:hypothetical protein CEXT_101841 [Caerostris extrusa]|uniref:Uncharacterized protein n=1 Tax=Caerostris extrusa TaxID=172846 RepID=A0AAV4Y508_CAEEX|nr:hypothetical protein CEXT_101841 [Caerostris extrusa]